MTALTAPPEVTAAAALEPLRAALLARAAAEAARVRADAEADARRRLDEARHEADRLVADARDRGAADAGWVLAAEETALRRSARGVVLAAQRDAWERLRRESRLAVRALLEEPGARDGLAALLRARLPGCSVQDTEDGGLLAEADDGRSIDASVAALVDRVLPGMDGERLWSPT